MNDFSIISVVTFFMIPEDIGWPLPCILAAVFEARMDAGAPVACMPVAAAPVDGT